VTPRTGSADGGATLKVRVAPGAKKERIVGSHGDALKVAVRQPPEGGRANRAVCKLVAEALAVPAREVTVLRGATSRDKVLLFAGRERDDLARMVAALLVTLGAA
jgi:uncharacterized protein (TIGR00251 family)